jgi:hypothetical protein
VFSGYARHILMVHLILCLIWVGINLYFISNQVLIKFDQLKILNAYSPVHYKAFAFILSPHLLSTTSAHPCYKQRSSERGSYSGVC